MDKESEFSEKFIEKTAEAVYSNLKGDGLSHDDIMDVVSLIGRISKKNQ